jgi:hypothetical protein
MYSTHWDIFLFHMHNNRKLSTMHGTVHLTYVPRKNVLYTMYAYSTEIYEVSSEFIFFFLN